MPLFYVQDSDSPMFVIASDFQEAVVRWRERIIAENPDDDCSEEQPHGVELLGEDGKILHAELDALRDYVERLRGLLARLLIKLPHDKCDSTTGRCAGCGVILWCGDGQGREPCKPDCVLQEAERELNAWESEVKG